MRTIGLLVAALATLSITAPTHAEQGFLSRTFSVERHKEVSAVSHPGYAAECSSCHYAYPPGLLPEASWRKLLAQQALSDHFGENIEMKEALRAELLDYAVKNAADHATAKRSQKILSSLAGSAPLRISEVAYIKRKHHEIPDKLIKGNAQVNSLAQCDTCHTDAKNGNLDDDAVVIPGHGRWRW
jgi:diheme cytochrome c